MLHFESAGDSASDPIAVGIADRILIGIQASTASLNSQKPHGITSCARRVVRGTTVGSGVDEGDHGW
jgi:hypothetical protein